LGEGAWRVGSRERKKRVREGILFERERESESASETARERE
jgi:hypothetical protein